MILGDIANNCATEGVNNKQIFKITASAKAFHILSANLYSNPVAAVIRELSTNAYDAHVLAGKTDIPFEISLPTALDNEFRIRDYGIGLSKDDILNIYTTFFESTKTNSNDVVGCLGLGSKTPFGVADMFTVKSIKDGRVTIATAYLDETRCPSVSIMVDMETTEPTGTEISFTFDPNKHEVSEKVLIDTLTRELAFFKVKPKVIPSVSWPVIEPMITVRTDTAYILGTDNHYAECNALMHKLKSTGPIMLVQGQIKYPIDTNVKEIKAVMEKIREDHKIVINYMPFLVLDAPIGSVTPTPSREALSYDSQTIAFIVSALESIAVKVNQDIKGRIDALQTDWMKALLSKLICSEYPYLSVNSNNAYIYREPMYDIPTKLKISALVSCRRNIILDHSEYENLAKKTRRGSMHSGMPQINNKSVIPEVFKKLIVLVDAGTDLSDNTIDQIYNQYVKNKRFKMDGSAVTGCDIDFTKTWKCACGCGAGEGFDAKISGNWVVVATTASKRMFEQEFVGMPIMDLRNGKLDIKVFEEAENIVNIATRFMSDRIYRLIHRPSRMDMMLYDEAYMRDKDAKTAKKTAKKLREDMYSRPKGLTNELLDQITSGDEDIMYCGGDITYTIAYVYEDEQEATINGIVIPYNESTFAELSRFLEGDRFADEQGLAIVIELKRDDEIPKNYKHISAIFDEAIEVVKQFKVYSEDSKVIKYKNHIEEIIPPLAHINYSSVNATRYNKLIELRTNFRELLSADKIFGSASTIKNSPLMRMFFEVADSIEIDKKMHKAFQTFVDNTKIISQAEINDHSLSVHQQRIYTKQWCDLADQLFATFELETLDF